MRISLSKKTRLKLELLFIKIYSAEKIISTIFKFIARFPRIKLIGNKLSRQLKKKVLFREFTIFCSIYLCKYLFIYKKLLN